MMTATRESVPVALSDVRRGIVGFPREDVLEGARLYCGHIAPSKPAHSVMVNPA